MKLQVKTVNRNKIMISILAIVFAIGVGMLFTFQKKFVVAEANIPQYSFEGNSEFIIIRFAEPLNNEVYLERYEFHYPMYPELALEQDTWNHDKQMSFMESVQSGDASPFEPDLNDKNIQRILEVSPSEQIKLETGDNKEFYTNWTASHGRIFFRIKVDDQYLEPVYTMRVHCKHIDMRSVEKLKKLLGAIELPLEHKNQAMALTIYDQAYSTYTKGHSLQFMLKHHEQSTAELDNLFVNLKEGIDNSDYENSLNILHELNEEINTSERVFFGLNAEFKGSSIEILLRDNINDYSFYEDPNTEVYVKRIEEDQIIEQPLIHTSHSKTDPIKHTKQLTPDKKELIDGAIKLENVGDRFVGEIPSDWNSAKIIVLYGHGQEYYLTKKVERNI